MLMPSSEQWGSGDWNTGRYPAKIYTIDGVLIYQADIGGDNTGKTPFGGVLSQGSPASSMLTTIANPITYYNGSGAVINQDGHSGDLYNYYWTSYSRGADGKASGGVNKPSLHNAYLDGYIPLRVKSIYDPCPYLYRIPSNGTFNQLISNPGWTGNSYLGGASWNINTLGASWFSGLGRRDAGSSVFVETGREGYCRSSTSGSQTTGYVRYFLYSKVVYLNFTGFRSFGQSVRCIEGFNVTFVAPKVTKMPKAKSTSASL